MPSSSGASVLSTAFAATVRRGPGRPKKFNRPSRVVSLTLPDDVIDRLERLDVDLGSAIVHLMERRSRPAAAATAPQVATYGMRAVIVVPHARALGKLAGVELIPIGSNRALIALDSAHRIPQFELAVRDLLDRGSLSASDRRTLHAITDILRDARLSGKVTVAERTIIVLEAKRTRNSSRKVPK
jgi:hypothetical protein